MKAKGKPIVQAFMKSKKVGIKINEKVAASTLKKAIVDLNLQGLIVVKEIERTPYGSGQGSDIYLINKMILSKPKKTEKKPKLFFKVEVEDKVEVDKWTTVRHFKEGTTTAELDAMQEFYHRKTTAGKRSVRLTVGRIA